MDMKGAGYSIEAILASVILFTFAMNAIQVPDGKDWSGFQREVAVRDISFVLKKTGELNTYLKNSDTGSIRTAATALSGRDLRVSGSIENLPLKGTILGFHTMPDEIHTNSTFNVGSGDPCYGDLGEIETTSERDVLRTNSSGDSLENRYDVRLYFTDSDPRTSGGFNGRKDYDTVWVDNGTRCIFTPSEGPYRTDEIFYWGNKTSSAPGKFFDFKDHMVSNRFTVYSADRAVKMGQALDRPLNSIRTDTSVDTFNFSSEGIGNYDILVFEENKSLERIESFESQFRDFLESGDSVLFLMNMTRSDTNYRFIQDIGFEWMNLSYESSVTEHTESFSNYEPSEELETYFRGLQGARSELSMQPGGKIISSQGTYRTSRNDLLFSRNAVYNTTPLDGTIKPGYSWNPAVTNCDTDTSTTFEFLDEDFTSEFDTVDYSVENIDLLEGAGCGERGLKIDKDRDGDLDGPFLENEIVRIEGRRYVPRISGPEDAEFVFAGSSKVELINHRQALENMQGGKVARAAYEKNFSEQDMKMLAATIYWLRGDQVQFTGRTTSTSLSTTTVGGIEETVFMPYKVNLRWSE